MAKSLTFTYDNQTYTLTYTRKTIQTMEKSGFVISELVDKPMTMIPQLFAGAFLANHRFTDQKKIEEIYANLSNKEELTEKLIEMYNEPLSTLMAEPDDDQGKVSWATDW